MKSILLDTDPPLQVKIIVRGDIEAIFGLAMSSMYKLIKTAFFCVEVPNGFRWERILVKIL